jgi:hypothetical protein
MTGSLLATALVRARSFLLEPVPAAAPSRPAIGPLCAAVIGMRRGSGTSTVARGLAAVPGANVVTVDDGATRRHDVTVLVAPGGGEPALATIAAELLEARGGRVVVAANRVRDPRPWEGHAAICLPDSRLAALLAGRGHLPPGELGSALARLAALVADAHLL